jgi:hypothetical protein
LSEPASRWPGPFQEKGNTGITENRPAAPFYLFFELFDDPVNTISDENCKSQKNNHQNNFQGAWHAEQERVCTGEECVDKWVHDHDEKGFV